MVFSLCVVPPVVLAAAMEQIALERDEATVTFFIEEASPPVIDLDIQWLFLPVGAETPIDITNSPFLDSEGSRSILSFMYTGTSLAVAITDIGQHVNGRFILNARNPAGTASNYTNLIVQGKECGIADRDDSEEEGLN